MSKTIVHDFDQLCKNLFQGRQMIMNERTKNMTIREIEKLEKANLEQLMERLSELDLENMID